MTTPRPPSIPSTKPYLLRALWEWCNDNGFTPYITVAVDGSCQVPREFVREGQIVLNIGAEATSRLSMLDEAISFQARFGGVARDIHIPIARVAALYAQENGVGMGFAVESVEEQGKNAGGKSEGNEGNDDPPPPGNPAPFLRRVK